MNKKEMILFIVNATPFQNYTAIAQQQVNHVEPYIIALFIAGAIIYAYLYYAFPNYFKKNNKKVIK